ncbi:MAG: tripartite tricarboxylate transporter substrate binding protein [Burkholderiaceae bacterium]
MKKLIKSALAAFASVACLTQFAPANAAYPERPVRLIVPFSAGGPTDTMARLVAEYLGSRLGQVITVINKPGADNLIAAREVVGSAADGYTLMFTTNGLLSIAPTVHPEFPIKPMKQFSFIGGVSSYPYMFVTGVNDKRNTLGDFIGDSRKNSGSVSYAVVGNVSLVAMALFKDSLDIDMLAVRYKGNSDTITDLFAERLNLGTFAPSFALPLLKANKVKPLAVTGEKRLAQLPDLPLASEIDPALKDFSVNSVVWTGIVAPVGVPEDIRARLEQELSRVVADDKFVAQVEKLGDQVQWRTGEQLRQRVESESAVWARVVKNTNLTLK